MALSVDVICWLHERLLPKARSEEKLVLKKMHVYDLGSAVISDEAQCPGNSPSLIAGNVM